MKTYLNVESWILTGSSGGTQPLRRISAKRVLVLDVVPSGDMPEGANGVLCLKQNETFSGEPVALDTAWVALESPQQGYRFTLSLNTEELVALFVGESPTVTLMADITITLPDEEPVATQTFEVIAERPVFRGDEQTPTPATSPTPVIQFIDDVPASKDDFFMFPGGSAPTSGMYQASDAHYNYTFKGGWSAWRRAAIALWCLAAACWLSGAQYDMSYIQRDGAGDNQERTLTLTPSTFLRVGTDGLLRVDSSADFKSALGLGISDISGLQTALDARASLSGSYADPSWITALAWSKITGKPTLGTAAATASSDYATAAQGALADTAVQPGGLLNVTSSSVWPPAIQAYGSGSGSGLYAEAAGSSAYAVQAKNSGSGKGLTAYSETGRAVDASTYTGTAIYAATGGTTGTGADISSNYLPLQISNTGTGADIAKFRRNTSTLVAIENSSSLTGRIRLAGGATYTGTIAAPALNTASRTWTLPDNTGTVALTSDITKSFIGLGNVENTALSTWAGSGNITTIGTLASGTVPVARVSGLGTLASQNGTFSGTSSGTNTGDQDLSGYALLSGNNTLTGNQTLTGRLQFDGATVDANKTTIAVVDPTAARTITFPDASGIVRITGQNPVEAMFASPQRINGVGYNASANAIAAATTSAGYDYSLTLTAGSAVAGNYASAAAPNFLLVPAATAASDLSYDFWLAVDFQCRATSVSNAEFYIIIGGPNTAEVSGRGLQLKITDQTIQLGIHNGSTLTTKNATVTNVGNLSGGRQRLVINWKYSTSTLSVYRGTLSGSFTYPVLVDTLTQSLGGVSAANYNLTFLMLATGNVSGTQPSALIGNVNYTRP